MPIIKKVITKEEGNRPVLVNFQNGQIIYNEHDGFKTSIYKNTDGKTIVGVNKDNMLYTGVIDNENDLYNNFLLVHNKATNKIRLIQVDCCTVSLPLENKSNLMNVSMATSVNSVADLSKQFGSKKSKRRTEQHERMEMNTDTVKGDLENTVSEIKVDETDTYSTVPTENDSLFRPNINRDASTVNQVYNLEEIVPKSVLDSLSDSAQSIVKGGDFSEFKLTAFASKNVSEILSSSPKELQVHRICVFLYIDYLIKFMNTPMKSITKKFVVCNKSVEVNNHILDNYSIATGHHRTRPLSMKDKALCSILVLAALAKDFQVDIEVLSKDFKTGAKKIAEISRILAFTTTPKTKGVVTLKLPLPPPVTMSLKRKRK